nr:hypothetical protein CFP56_72046 [Quercus suber]
MKIDHSRPFQSLPPPPPIRPARTRPARTRPPKPSFSLTCTYLSALHLSDLSGWALLAGLHAQTPRPTPQEELGSGPDPPPSPCSKNRQSLLYHDGNIGSGYDDVSILSTLSLFLRTDDHCLFPPSLPHGSQRSCPSKTFTSSLFLVLVD